MERLERPGLDNGSSACMTGFRPWDRVSAAGGVYLHTAGEQDPAFLGSCSALGRATHFVTAAHCVRNLSVDELRISHWGQRQGEPFSRVTACEIDVGADLAVLQTEVANPQSIQPFQALSAGVAFGEPVSSIGWPVGILAEYREAALRVMRGYVQRQFFYRGLLGGTYQALELHFASPPGLSGAPVFLDAHPFILLGVMTENFQSLTRIDSVEEEKAPGEFRRIETHEMVTYGVAVNPFHAIRFLEDVIGLGSLNALDRPTAP